MVDPRHYCRSCRNCDAKFTNACAKWGFVGLSGGGGGLSETVAIHHEQLYPIPESVLENAALIEPLAVAWHAVKASQIPDFKELNVLILGGGPVGIALIYVLRYCGAKMIAVSEPTKTRRAQNEKLADIVINPTDEKVGDKCRSLTDGNGVDVVFDAAGVPAGLEAGMDAVRHRGMYVNVAGWEKPVCTLHFPLHGLLGLQCCSLWFR
jgi:threonine dehydrogenase-like Zn-dependent dehydrogenase